MLTTYFSLQSSKVLSMKNFLGLCLVSCSIIFLSPSASAMADEIYEYDALGRLKKVTQEDGSITAFTYDPAGNRTAINITGSNNPDADPHMVKVVVVPLNGFTVIPFN